MKEFKITTRTKKPLGYSTQYVYLFIQLREAVFHYKKILEKDKKAENSKAGNRAYLLLKYQYLREAARYNVNILSGALIEALINTWLSMKTSDEQFSILERAQLKEKWVSLPTLFNKKYKLDKSSRTYECLDSIIEMRNFIVHMKPMIIGFNKTLRKGNYSDKHSREKLKPDEYVMTPVQLWIHLYDHEKDPQIKSIMGTFKYYFDIYKQYVRRSAN